MDCYELVVELRERLEALEEKVELINKALLQFFEDLESL